MIGKLDDLLAVHTSKDCICMTSSRRFVLFCLKFFTTLLRNCQNKRFFLSLDVSNACAPFAIAEYLCPISCGIQYSACML